MKHWLWMSVLVAPLLVFAIACGDVDSVTTTTGAGTVTATARSSTTATAPIARTPSSQSATADRLTVSEFADAIEEWANNLSSNAVPDIGTDPDGNADIDDESYRRHVDQEFKDLDTLKALNPPEQLTAQHRVLVDAFRQFCEADRRFQQAEAARDVQASISAASELDVLLYEVEDALNELLRAAE